MLKQINTTLFISSKKLKFKTAAKVVLIVQKTLKIYSHQYSQI